MMDRRANEPMDRQAMGVSAVELRFVVAMVVVEGSLETKVPTIWTDEKQHSQEEAEPGRNSDV